MKHTLVRQIALLTLTAILISSCGGAASLRNGAHVRVTASQYDRPRILGTLQEIEPHHLVIKPSLENQTLLVPRDMITSLQIRSRSRRTGTGALVGAIGFGFLGGTVVPTQGCETMPEYCQAMAAVMFGASGAILGAVVGTFNQGEGEWKAVPIREVRGEVR